MGVIDAESGDDVKDDLLTDGMRKWLQLLLEFACAHTHTQCCTVGAMCHSQSEASLGEVVSDVYHAMVDELLEQTTHIKVYAVYIYYEIVHKVHNKKKMKKGQGKDKNTK